MTLHTDPHTPAGTADSARARGTAPTAAERRAYVRDWIAKRQGKLAASALGSAVLALPALAQAQSGTGDYVAAGSLEGVSEVEVLQDGSAQLSLSNGRTVVVAAEEVQVLAGGEVMIAPGAAEVVGEVAAMEAAAGLSTGAMAAAGGVAAAAGAALANDSSGGGGPETLNRADFTDGGISSESLDITAEDATSITLTIGGTDYTADVDADGNWTLPDLTAAEADALPQGETDIDYVTTDDEGEEVDSGTVTFNIDTIAPTIAIDAIAGDDVLNAAEQDEDLTITGTTDAEEGQEVTVTLGGTDYTGTVDANGDWSVEVAAADLAGLADGATVAVTADVEDAAGNPAAQASASFDTDFSVSIAIDEIAGGELNAGDIAGGVTVTGTTDAEDGQEVTLSFAGADYTGTASGGTWSIDVPEADLDALDDDTTEVAVSAAVSDAAGNSASAEQTLAADFSEPSIAIDTPVAGDDVLNAAEQGADLTVSGTAGNVDGRDVTVTMNGTDYTATVSGGTWSVDIPSADLAALTDGDTVTIDATVSDGAGLSASDSADLATDFTAPTIAIDEIGDGGVVDVATLDDPAQITGTTDAGDGQEVTVNVDGTDYTGTASGGTWSVDIPTGDLETGQTVAVTADVSDAAGNPAAQASQNVTLYEASVFTAVQTALSGTDGSYALETDLSQVDGGDVNSFQLSVNASDAVTLTPGSAAINSGLAGAGVVNEDNIADGVLVASGLSIGGVSDFEGDPILAFDGTVDTAQVVEVSVTNTPTVQEVDGDSAGISTSYFGTASADTLTAANTDTLVRGQGGDDSIDVSAAGVNRVVFEAAAADNGTDTVTGFTLGADSGLADQIAFAGLTQADLRGAGTDAETVATGDALGADTGLAVFSTALGGIAAGDLAGAAEGLTGEAAGDELYVMASDGSDAALARVTFNGTDDADAEIMAQFQGLGDLSGMTGDNILGFDTTGIA